MLRNYKKTKDEVYALLKDTKNLSERVSKIESITVIKLYQRIIQQCIDKIILTRIEKTTVRRKRQDDYAKLEALHALSFALEEREQSMQHESQQRQFLMLAILSDKVNMLTIPKSEKDAKETVAKDEMYRARESVTLEVLENHQAVVDQLRETIKQKEELEALLRQDKRLLTMQEKMQRDIVDLAKKIEGLQAGMSIKEQKPLSSTGFSIWEKFKNKQLPPRLLSRVNEK